MNLSDESGNVKAPNEIDFCDMTAYGIEVFFINLANDPTYENFVYSDDTEDGILRVFTKEKSSLPDRYHKGEWMIYKSIEVLTINIADKDDIKEIKQKYQLQAVINGL